jgi:hypothetical protein
VLVEMGEGKSGCACDGQSGAESEKSVESHGHNVAPPG